MTGIPATLRIAAISLLLSGCGNLLHADFESGAEGQSPVTPPPGPPAGDSITAGDADIFFVSTLDAIAGTRSLTVREAEPSLRPTGTTTIFRTAPIGNPDAPIYYSWQGFFPTDDGGMVINCGLLGQFFGNLTFDNGQIRLFDTVVGSYDAGQSHTVIVSLFPASRTYRVGIFGDTQLNGDFAEADLRQISGTAVNEGFLEITPTIDAAQDRIYVMDEVTASQTAP